VQWDRLGLVSILLADAQLITILCVVAIGKITTMSVRRLQLE
jgi:hypothetical protein